MDSHALRETEELKEGVGEELRLAQVLDRSNEAKRERRRRGPGPDPVGQNRPEACGSNHNIFDDLVEHQRSSTKHKT